MLKIRIAVATVFGMTVASSGFAQSSVTLYGRLDGGLLYTNRTLDSTTGQNAGSQLSFIDTGLTPSLFGLTGTEDLGGGVKAIFKLQSGFSVANGGYANSNGNAFGNQAWVALNGTYGEVKTGLQFSPFFLTTEELDPRHFSYFGSGLITYVDNIFATGMFTSNAVSYTSPDIAGFKASVLLALGGQAGDFSAGRQYSASLKYESGGLMVGAAIFDGNGGGTVSTPIPTTVAVEGRTLGGAYKFGSLTVKASFVNYKVAGSFNNNVYGGGLDYLVTPSLDVNGGVWVTSDRDDTKNHSVLGALGTEYFLSKATTLYAQVGIVNNHGVMDTGLSINSALFGLPGSTVGADVGIRHTF